MIIIDIDGYNIILSWYNFGLCINVWFFYCFINNNCTFVKHFVTLLCERRFTK